MTASGRWSALWMICFASTAVAHAAQARAEPKGASAAHLKPLSEVQLVVLPPPDVEALRAEDAQMDTSQEAPRFAYPMILEIAPDKFGIWEPFDGQTDIWRLRISAPGAQSLNLGFTQYFMPTGGDLFLYPAEYIAGTDLHGDQVRHFTETSNKSHGELWTPVVPGDDMVIEVSVPRAQREALRLQLSQVGYDYTGFGRLRAKDSNIFPASGSCNVDVACDDGTYYDQIRAVATYQRGGSRVCTGSLINNTAFDGTPFFITAAHCGVNAGNARSLVAYFNYQNSYCRSPGSPSSGQPGDGSLSQFTSGSTFASGFGGSNTSDFTLVYLDYLPPEYGAFLAGWDRRALNFDSPVGIHHPRVQEKRISYSFRSTAFSGSTHLQVFWGLGVTEPGSSGSPIYAGGLFIGQLTGGPSACGSSQLWDFYGRMSRSWTGGNTFTSRLSDWLDYVGTGETAIVGMDAF